MHVLNTNKSKLYAELDNEISELIIKKINELLELRLKKPLSQILNKHIFYKDEFYINDKVLIPRSETESIVDEIIKQGDLIYKEKRRCVLLDAGTGSGCVGCSVQNETQLCKCMSQISVSMLLTCSKDKYIIM